MKKECYTCKYDEDCRWDDCLCGDPPTRWEPAEHYKPDTNADRLRTMSDEEQGRCLMNINDSGCFISFCKNKPECNELLDNDGITDEMCMECMMQWLKQPAEVDHE